MDKSAASLFSNDTVQQVAATTKKSQSCHHIPLSAEMTHFCLTSAPGQVILRWATQRGIAVIPKSTTDERLAENLGNLGFDLSEEQLKSISSLNTNLRVCF